MSLLGRETSRLKIYIITLSIAILVIVGIVFAIYTLRRTGEQVSFKQTSSEVSCTGFYQICQTADGKAGKQWCEKGAMNKNVCAFDLNLTTQCVVEKGSNIPGCKAGSLN